MGRVRSHGPRSQHHLPNTGFTPKHNMTQGVGQVTGAWGMSMQGNDSVSGQVLASRDPRQAGGRHRKAGTREAKSLGEELQALETIGVRVGKVKEV